MNAVSLLSQDPDLGAEIPEEKLELAQRACVARVLEVPHGEWDWERSAAGDSSGYGLLVLSGLLCRRVVQGQRYGAELLGPGDLLRPWDKIGEWSSIPTDADWLVIENARLAVLDGASTASAASTSTSPSPSPTASSPSWWPPAAPPFPPPSPSSDGRASSPATSAPGASTGSCRRISNTSPKTQPKARSWSARI